MAKPIFTIGLPDHWTHKDIQPLQEQLDENFKDYYVLIYVSDAKTCKFQCFYEKDFNKVKYEEFKKIVKKLIAK